MKAIEIKARTDKNGNLLISKNLHFSNKEVRVLILVEDEDIDEKSWLSALSVNPSFDFLKEHEEDIYTAENGKPFND
jgi:hypothetical protein